MLLPSKEIIAKAEDGGYAVGAFNAVNMETAQAVFAAAERERAPFLIQITQTTLAYTEPEELFAVVRTLADRCTVPVALHLDHGRSFDLVMRFLRLGMTSVMIDGSLQEDGKTPRSYEENVEVTRKVVAAAHAIGVTVEGEIGRLGVIKGEHEDHLTNPAEARKFVDDTGVDLLAVGIGTTHGLYKGTPKIDHDRLKEINTATPVALVMHGGTGVPDDAVRKAVELGIRKINIDTQIRVAFFDAVAEQVHKTEKEHAEAEAKGDVRKYDIRKLLAPARDAMVEAIAEKMRLFGSAGKA
ncbi:MAG: class II fructose-bisphosphate aldolase [Armatimonadota bacterium]|nr:MAG: class II fructose-bisphosphate aldolase [Armatimonadota bacterium]